MDKLEKIIDSYDLGKIRHIEPHGGTAGKTWTLNTGKGSFFLRKRGVLTAGKVLVKFDHQLRRELEKNAFPTLAPLPAISGDTALYDGNDCYELYKFVQNGRVLSDSNRIIIENSAKTLAAMHKISYALLDESERLPLVSQYNFPGLKKMSRRLDDVELLAELYAGFIKDTDSKEAAKYQRQIKFAAEIIKKLLSEYPQELYEQLPRTVIHGDYTLANILFDDDYNISGVFDFDWSRAEVRIRDIADGLYFIAGKRRRALLSGDIWSLTELVELDRKDCARWLTAYNKKAPLSKLELKLIPYAFAARWLSIRLQGSAKVAASDRAKFCFETLAEPVKWLFGNWNDIRLLIR